MRSGKIHAQRRDYLTALLDQVTIFKVVKGRNDLLNASLHQYPAQDLGFAITREIADSPDALLDDLEVLAGQEGKQNI
jgi:hypothetical protein